jgi:hypothetical protein
MDFAVTNCAPFSLLSGNFAQGRRDERIEVKTSSNQLLHADYNRIATIVHSVCLSGNLAEGRRDERIEVRAFTDGFHPRGVSSSKYCP